MKRSFCLAGLMGAVIAGAGICSGQSSNQVVLDRKGETIVLEPYGPNIVRVTLSLQKENALGKPGYGFVGSPDEKGWAKSQTDTDDVYKSSRITLTVERPHALGQPPLQTQIDISKYFGGSTPGAHITFTNADGKKLLEMTGGIRRFRTTRMERRT